MVRVNDILKDEYIAVRDNEQLTSLFGKFLQKRQTEAFVFSSASPSAKDFVGMFAYPHLPFRVDSADVTIRTVTRPAPQLRVNDTVLRAGQLMFESGHAALPVVDDKEFLGVVRAYDVLHHLRDQLDNMKVSSIAGRNSPTIRFDASLGELITLMRNENTDRVPVVDVKGDYVGFVSYLDLVENYYVHAYERDHAMRPGSVSTRAFKAEMPNVLNLPVENVMNRGDAVAIGRSDTLAAAIDKMIAGNVLSVVLLDGAKPMGVVTLHDILHAVMAAQVEEIPAIHYKGLRELDIDDMTRAWLQKISSYYVERLQTVVNGDVDVIVHIKERSQGGETHRYTVNTRLSFPGATLAAESNEWDLRRAVHDAFGGLEAELGHFLKHADNRAASVHKLAAQEGNPNLPGDLAAE